MKGCQKRLFSRQKSDRLFSAAHRISSGKENRDCGLWFAETAKK